MSQKDLLISWLNDAYAMEQGLIPVLQNHMNDVKAEPEAHARIQRHLEETKRQAERVKSCIERLGSSVSTLKAGTSWVMGKVQGASTGMFEDELVKNVLSDYAAEHFEIAAYRAIITLADSLGDAETVRLCRDNMKEEEEMASWLAMELPTVVRKTSGRQPVAG